MGENQSSFIIVGVVAAVLLLIMYGGVGGTRGLDRSPIGTNGLSVWLDDNDVPTDRSHRRTTLSELDVALRIIPLYDTNLDAEAGIAVTEEEQRRKDTLRDLDSYTFYDKVTYLPSLVMLPKWRGGVLELDLLDEQLLIPESRFRRLLDQMNVGHLRLIRPTDKFLTTTDDITLFYPQLFERSSVKSPCRPAVTISEGVLIAECKGDEGIPMYVLSDPDFMNNHGLALGNNAPAALHAITDLAGDHGGTIYIDTSDEILLTADPDAVREIRPRTVEDVSRFLTYPFSLIWIGAAICFFVLLWRGLIRFGPPRRVDQGHIVASKTASIESKGYLLRLAGDDHALLQAYVADKMTAIGHDVMGRQAKVEGPKLMKRLHAIAPKIASQLEATLAEVDGADAGWGANDLTRLTEKFEDIYRRLRDELGHVSRRR